MTLADRKIGYILGSYPSMSQTFVLREMLQLEATDVTLMVFALRGSFQPLMSHPESRRLRAGVTYLLVGGNVISAVRTILAHIRCLLTSPLRYMRALRFLMDGRSELLGHFVHAGRVAIAARGNNITHLHAHFAGEPASVALFASLMSGVPFTFTVHAWDIFVPDRFLKDKIESSRAVVAISEYNRHHLTELYGDDANHLLDKVRVIHLGVPVAEFAALRSGTGKTATPQIPVLLTVARLVAKKGHLNVVDALEILRGRRFPVRWIVAGDGPERADLMERIRAKGLSDSTEFVGTVDSQHVKRLLTSADLFVLPCTVTSEGDMDGIPVSIMEAMAAGVPVISTPVSGIPELIVNQVSGLLVEQGNAVALADAIQLVLGDVALYDRIASDGQNQVAEHFELTSNVRKLKELFEGVQTQVG